MSTNQLWLVPNVMHEDKEFTTRAFLCADKVVNTHICFYYYVIHKGSITMAPDLQKNMDD